MKRINLEKFITENCSYSYSGDGSQLIIEDDCPWCGKSGKIYVSVEDNIGLCFYCSEGFHANKFVRAMTGGTSAAFKAMETEDSRFLHKERDTDFWVPEMTSLPDHAMQYLEKRGISPELIDRFSIKYSPDNIRIKNKLKFTGKRIIIPVYSIGSKLVGWTGRDISGKQKIKYLFPDHFRASQHLYNANTIKTDQPYLILSEGVFDVYGWYKAGFKSVVASFGKKISPEQLRIIKRLKPRVLFLAWDTDAYWQKQELASKLTNLLKVKIVDLNGRDSDELEKDALYDALINSEEYSWSAKIYHGLQRLDSC